MMRGTYENEGHKDARDPTEKIPHLGKKMEENDVDFDSKVYGSCNQTLMDYRDQIWLGFKG